MFSLALGSYQTYKEGGDFVLPKNNDETRIWPQILLLQSIGKFKVEQLYRAEMRFISDGYRDRFLSALSYKPNKHTTMSIGYLHQFDYQINDETGLDFLQLGYYLELFR